MKWLTTLAIVLGCMSGFSIASAADNCECKGILVQDCDSTCVGDDVGCCACGAIKSVCICCDPDEDCQKSATLGVGKAECEEDDDPDPVPVPDPVTPPAGG